MLMDLTSRTNSNSLLLHLILCSSILGSIVNNIKNENFSVLKIFSEGIGAGIVCFLAIESGGVNPYFTGELSLHNPYLNSFVGFLGGIFSTDVFDVLKKNSTVFFERITSKQDK